MAKIQFVNFIAFGKRNSIDLRIVTNVSYSRPSRLHQSGEIPQNGSPSSVIRGFNDLAASLFENLLVDLNDIGETGIIEMLMSLKDEAESEAYAEHGCTSQESTFAMWVSFLASLNETTFNI